MTVADRRNRRPPKPQRLPRPSPRGVEPVDRPAAAAAGDPRPGRRAHGRASAQPVFGAAARHRQRAGPSARIGDTLDTYEMRAVTGLFYAIGWDCAGDRRFRSRLRLLGGRTVARRRRLRTACWRRSATFPASRSTSAQFIFEEVGTALQADFRRDPPIRASGWNAPRRAWTSPVRAGAITRRWWRSFILQAINRGGEMFVIIPQSALAADAPGSGAPGTDRFPDADRFGVDAPDGRAGPGGHR